VIGPATFSGHSATEVDSTQTLSTGPVFTNKTFGAIDSDGAVGFGDTSTETANGSVTETSQTTDDPEALDFPPTMAVGVSYMSNYTQNSSTTFTGSSTPTTTSRTVSAQITLSAETLQSVTVPAGTFNAYLINVSQIDTPQGQSPQSSTIQEWAAPGVGFVKISTDVNGNVIDEELTSFTPAGGGGGAVVTSSISKDTLPTTFVPGDRGIVALALHNSGSTLLHGGVDVSAFLTPDGVPGDGVAVTLPKAYSDLAVAIPGGGTRFVAIPVTAPADVATGTEEVAVTVTPVSGFASDAIDTMPAVDTTARTATLSFGTVGSRGHVLLSTSVGGATTRFLVSGPGTGTLVPAAGGGSALSLTGTTAASNVIVLGPVGGVTLGGISDPDPFGAIIGLHTNVNGNVTLDGGGRLLLLSNLSSARTFLDGSASMELVLGNVTDSSFQSNEPFSTVVMNSWINTTPQSFSAPSGRVFLDKGDLTGGTLATTGDITSAIILGNLSGNVLAGANLGTDQQLGGGDDTFRAARIGAFTVRGNVVSSIVAAGLSATDDTFPLTGNDSLLTGGVIGPVFVGGTLSTDSHVLAATLPKFARLHNLLVKTLGDPQFVRPP
jgi:hypothetical protein